MKTNDVPFAAQLLNQALYAANTLSATIRCGQVALDPNGSPEAHFVQYERQRERFNKLMGELRTFTERSGWALGDTPEEAFPLLAELNK